MSVDELAVTSPMLSDGTLVTDLIDVEQKRASLRLFSDPEVYRLELQHLFARAWNIVGHETEIPNVGDFVLRSIGQDSVIVTRGREGEIAVMLNVCPHRGMQVCRSEYGSQGSFKCPYHGWTFDTAGNMLGAPYQREMYGESFDRSELGLRPARVSLYAGIIFANWDPTAPPLEDFLGDYTWYLDAIFKRTPAGVECVGPPQRFVMRANWKAPSEQFNGADGYHTVTLHRTLLDMMSQGASEEVRAEITRKIMFGIDIGTPQGHGIRCIMDPRMTEAELSEPAMEILKKYPPIYLPPELVDRIPESLNEGQVRMMATYPPYPGGMFPNVGMLHMNIRTHVPLGVGAFEMRNWILVEKDAPQEFKDAVRKEMLFSFGTNGAVEQDDSEAWPSMQRSATGFIGSQQTMKYQAFVGHHKPDDWEGGGYVYEGFSKDDSAWNFWMRYREYMSGRPW